MNSYIIYRVNTNQPISISEAAETGEPVRIEYTMDNIQKTKGVPYSTSRKEERRNKHRTIKARRQYHAITIKDIVDKMADDYRERYDLPDPEDN